MADTPSESRFSPVLRQQLHELRIDPDGSPRAQRRHRLAPILSWCSRHTQVLILVGTATLLVVVCTVLLVVTVMASAPSRTAPGNLAPGSVAVSYEAMSVQLAPPSYRHMAPGEAVVLLHLEVKNATNARSSLAAGDLSLADANGAVFPASWHDADGNLVDGLSNPTHTLLALDPGAAVTIGVQFLVLSDGPFSLQYQQRNPSAAGPLQVTVANGVK